MTSRFTVINLGALLVLAVAAMTSLSLGATSYTPLDLFNLVFNDQNDNLRAILFEVRLPRTIAAIAVGMALAQVGGVLQAAFSNSLADPTLIGLSPIAAIGTVLAFSLGSLIIGIIFGFTLLFFALTYLSALNLPAQKFILAAVAFGSFATAGLGVLTSSPLNTSGKSLTAWIFGSLATVNTEQTLTLCAFVAVGTVILTRLHTSLDFLSLGERTATNLGVNIPKERTRVFVAASILLTPAVAVAGVIGFVGLAIPMFVRHLVGGRHRHQQLLVIILGGFAVLVADTVSRNVCAPVEIALGITLAVIGAPIMFRGILSGEKNV